VIPKEFTAGVRRKLRLLPEGRQRPELTGVTSIKENSTGQARNRPLHKVRICQHGFIIHTTFSSNGKVDKLDLDCCLTLAACLDSEGISQTAKQVVVGIPWN
jgi:hypothetical protein